ncbi:hypothetical protein ACQPXH_06580 [Nocardia sp. CA-135953]
MPGMQDRLAQAHNAVYTAITGDQRPTRAPQPCSLVDAAAKCTDPITIPC